MPRRLSTPEERARMSAAQLTQLTPEQRRARSRLGAYVQWSREPDRRARTQAARDGQMRRFEDQVDPDRVHPPEVRAQMAQAAMRAHMLRISRLPRTKPVGRPPKAGRDGRA